MIPADLTIPDGSILTAYRGSIAHNMYVPKNDPNHIDDIDIMGVVVGVPETYFGLDEWGSRGTKEAWQGHYDCVWYEIRKMFSMLLQGNPNVMSLLWLRPQDYLYLNEVGDRIVANRRLFVGKHVYESFAGYASAQLLKMESRDPASVREYLGVTFELKVRGIHPTDQNYVKPEECVADMTDCKDWSSEKLLQRLKHFQKKGENLGYLGDKRKKLVLQHGYDAKNAAHCIRLLRMAKEFLATGEMQVYRTSDAAELLDIKAGRWTIDQIHEHATQLFAEVKAARDASNLPDGPDRAGAEALLVDIVREVLA